ncbi:MAG TPA: RsmE family RNA methyltransferase [Tepidisphaeraceae bacterium]
MRRVHVTKLEQGDIILDAVQAHHVRDVLRLESGDQVEAFDGAGSTAAATLAVCDPQRVVLRVGRIEHNQPSVELTIASALPKGERADWMIEKLSELGVTRFTPLRTARSVVHPEGKNKFDRWTRIATESAKQSHRPGVMIIDSLTKLESLLASASSAVYLSPQSDDSLLDHAQRATRHLILIIGPEGGWTNEELALFESKNVLPARMTRTVLRIETAAITAAAIAQSSFARRAS